VFILKVFMYPSIPGAVLAAAWHRVRIILAGKAMAAAVSGAYLM
jgi:NaMN:DMB phosphoribosyltransferase